MLAQITNSKTGIPSIGIFNYCLKKYGEIDGEMSAAIEYKKDPSKRQRLWLNLPSEERPILDKALKLAD